MPIQHVVTNCQPSLPYSLSTFVVLIPAPKKHTCLHGEKFLNWQFYKTASENPSYQLDFVHSNP